MKSYTKYIISAVLVLVGIFLAFASKVMFPVELNNFWRILMEIGGYALIAAGCGVFVKSKE